MNKKLKTLVIFLLIGFFFSLSATSAVFAKDKIKIKKNTEVRTTETTGVLGGNDTLLIQEDDITDEVLNEIEKTYNDVANSEDKQNN